MKQFENLLFVSLILLCWLLASCKTSKAPSGWSLVWEENFSRKKSFDSKVWSPYLTGGVYTKGKKAFDNGRIEICAKLNAAKGAWVGAVEPADLPVEMEVDWVRFYQRKSIK